MEESKMPCGKIRKAGTSKTVQGFKLGTSGGGYHVTIYMIAGKAVHVREDGYINIK